ncbi:hypothetical protein [Pelagicoccus sp. SDUM812005]|uniref:hypothetical protein n=1 Tax=Pelagicoccus sp. SDUM812005 TaxID=3041257 RepID=UPI00280F5862|nr:hypothetical protein [Pelagicoccus sp. SDUM812005]MDQ8179075.1 hypothetical protein [Pelagicoccus sp. SDUM812005]
MFSRFLRNLLLVLLGFLLAGTSLSAKRFNILVNAEAEEDYLERTADLEYQTYHIVKGKFHGGSTRDRGLETTRFEDLFESLEETLRKRSLYPEPDRHKGDLLIMVSWGRTSLDPNWGELQGIASASDLGGESGLGSTGSEASLATASAGADAIAAPAQTASAASAAGEGFVWGSGGGSQRSKNMALLGLEGKLRSRNLFGPDPDEELWNALEEERYFVILNAFDYQHLIHNKELKQVWRVRYNTRAIGLGFETAFESMNAAVADVIGLQMDDIAKVKGDTSGRISMGEIEMVKMTESDKKAVGE